MAEQNTQQADFPYVLESLVNGLKYKEGWRFYLQHVNRGQGCEGLTLEILITCADAYQPDTLRSVMHYFPVPAAAYNGQSWRRWLFDRVVEVETHEAMEFFQTGELRPYAPNHGPGNDPYTIREMTTDEERRTSFRGEVKEIQGHCGNCGQATNTSPCWKCGS